MTQDLTTYSELDPNNRLSRTATTESFVGLARNESAGAWVAYTSGENFYAEGKFNIASAAGGALASNVAFSFSDTASVNTQANVNHAGIWLICPTDSSPPVPYAHLRESSTPSSTAGTALAFATDYWYKNGVYSSLGRYGAVVTQVFSDSGYATLLQVLLKARTAAKSYDYHYSAQSTNLATAGTITGTHADITLYQPAAGINLTTGVETDTGTSRLDVYADCIVATALNIANSETAKHVAIDEGAGFFADYKVSGVMNITAFVSTVFSKRFNILSVTNAAADAAAANDLQGISIEDQGATTYKPYIHQAVGGTDTFSTAGSTLNLNQPYSFTLERSGTTLTLKVWNDLVLDVNMQGTSQVGSTVTWTGRATTTYRYLMPVASYLNGATSRSSTFTLGGVRISGGQAPFEVTGADTAATGDSAAGSLAFALSATDTAATGDASTMGFVQAVSAAESATIGDSAIGGLEGSTACVETAVTSDAASASVIDSGVAEVSAAETAATGDAASALVGDASYVKRFWRVIGYNDALGYDAPVPNLLPRPQYMLLRPADGSTCDFGDSNAFKDASACVDLQDDFLEFDSVNWPGVYYYPLRVDVLANGKYVEAGESPATPGFFTELEEFVVYGGEIVDPPSAAAVVAANAARIVDGAITGEIFDKSLLAFAAGKRRGLVPGAAIPALEEYLRQDGATAQISLSPTDVAGNGTPVINQAP